MRRHFPLILLLISILSSCSLSPIKREGHVHLIFVALDYSNTKYVSNLFGPIDDAKELGACLESHYKRRSIPFDSRYLLAEGSMANKKDRDYPSSENILSAIENLSVSKDDLIVFYYSGHGSLYSDSEDKAYLVTGMTEGIPEGLYQENGELLASWYQDLISLGYSPSEISEITNNAFPYTFLPLETLYRVLDSKDARSVVIIDSCNSGAITSCSPTEHKELSELISDAFISPASYRYLSIITSSTATQTSRVVSFLNEDNIQEMHSLFTSDLLETLGWHHSSSETALSSLGSINGYIKEPISSLSIRDLWSTLESKSTSRQTYMAAFSGLDTVLIP